MMTSKNNQPNIQDISNKEKKFKLNLDILSSLKPLKGKVLNFDSDNLIQEKKDLNKTNYSVEDKLSTSCSMSKLSNVLFYSNFQSYKKQFTTNSILYPILKNNETQFRTQSVKYNPNINYDNIIQNQNPNIYLSNFNSFNQNYSENQFYSLINQNIFLNRTPPNQQKISLKKSFSPIKIIYNEEITQNNEISKIKNNILLNKKRKTENINNINKNNNDVIKKNNINNKNGQINNVIFVSKKQIEKSLPLKSNEKIKFSVYKKSKYVFKKRKPRIKKLNLKKIKMKCGHEGCEGDFKTKKQLVFHHYKMSIECHNDTIALLKLISYIKKLLKKENNINIEKYSLLYKEAMNNISLDEYINAITGYNFED